MTPDELKVWLSVGAGIMFLILYPFFRSEFKEQW